MCGISGGYNLHKDQVEKMVKANAHRGPDATGFKEVGPVLFGHNRLSIIDTSERSNQPMCSPDGRHTLVYNGEIYNFKKLRALLPHWSFKTEGDSEVLLAALATWGEEALSKIEGIFAFAWYDKMTDTLVLVRDHLGAKPLYYYHEGDSLCFSSELSGILAGTELRELDQAGLSHYFSGNYVPSPQTIVKGVQKLRAGHVLHFKHGQVQTKRYFTPQTPTNRGVTHEEIRQVIGGEVTAQLVSDRPIGVFLSGGFDSSIVLHHASKVGKIRTFSTSFEMIEGGEADNTKFNADSIIAAKTAKHYGCEHTNFAVSLTQVRDELLPLLERLDEPVANPITASQLLLSKSVRDAGIVVALGGDGGDELWGGYSRHQAVLLAHYFQTLPRFFRNAVVPLHPSLKKLNIPVGAPLHESLTTFDSHRFKGIFKNNFSHQESRILLESRYQESTVAILSPIDAFMRVDREMWLADDALHRSDRASMAVGVELRVPLLGLPIVNLADSIEGIKKFTPLTNKKIIRQAYKGFLPDHLYTEPKRGWMAPGSKWFRDPILEGQIRSVFSNEYYDGLQELVDWDAVQTLLTKHIETRTYALNPLWNLLVLQIWARKHKLIFKSETLDAFGK